MKENNEINGELNNEKDISNQMIPDSFSNVSNVNESPKPEEIIVQPILNNNENTSVNEVNNNFNSSATNESNQNNAEQPVYEEVKPQFEEVVIEKKPEEIRTDSYFDGKLLELIGWNVLNFLLTAITFGIANPWGKCMLLKFEMEHTVLNGKRLKFIGNGGNLFVEQFKWFFLTIITLGIYGLWVPIKRTKWIAAHIHFEDEEYVKDESYFDGKLIQLIGVNILTALLNLISFGLLFTFTTCFRLRWLAKHMVINRKKVVFEGSALALFGKYILWVFLTIITFGIYGLWLTIKIKKWEVKNTRLKLAGEEYKKDDLIIWLLVGALIFVLPFIIIINQIISNI